MEARLNHDGTRQQERARLSGATSAARKAAAARAAATQRTVAAVVEYFGTGV